MNWTPQALKGVAHELVTADDESIDAAIAYAEQLAEEVGAQMVDTDLWRQAWAGVKRAHRLARHRPPKLHHETRDAS